MVRKTLKPFKKIIDFFVHLTVFYLLLMSAFCGSKKDSLTNHIVPMELRFLLAFSRTGRKFSRLYVLQILLLRSLLHTCAIFASLVFKSQLCYLWEILW